MKNIQYLNNFTDYKLSNKIFLSKKFLKTNFLESTVTFNLRLFREKKILNKNSINVIV